MLLEPITYAQTAPCQTMGINLAISLAGFDIMPQGCSREPPPTVCYSLATLEGEQAVHVARMAILSLVVAISGACSPRIADTGFTGAWERPLNGGYSSLAIREADDGYHVRWNKIDGNQTVRCDEDGSCEEFVGEEKVYEWRFRAFSRPDSPDLFVEVTGVPIGDRTPMRYTDRLVLQPGGRELWSYQIEENGVERDPPGNPLKFHKVSNDPS